VGGREGPTEQGEAEAEHCWYEKEMQAFSNT
jgi:hypothetical protein